MDFGRTDDARIWRDLQNLKQNGSLSSHIQQAIRSSATLVVLLSKGYLSSDWCRRERELFVREAGGIQEARDRIFLVKLHDIKGDDLPEELRDVLGCDFFYTDSVTQRTRLLADPVPRVDQPEYFERTSDLSESIHQHLSQVTPVATSPEPEPKATVFLAPTTKNLEDDYRAITDFLDEKGYSWLPRNGQSPGSTELQECQLFVQLLGARPETRLDDLPYGSESSIFGQAQSLGFLKEKSLRWRTPKLSPSALNAMEESDDDTLQAHHHLVPCHGPRYRKLRSFPAEKSHRRPAQRL